MIRFYIWEPGIDSLPDIPPTSGLTAEVWRPSPFSFRPRGLPLLPYAAWWAFHYSGVFANPCYGLILLRQGSDVVHRCLVTPRYFRFADMGVDDLQVGAVFTETQWRGRGLATVAVRMVCEAWAGQFSRLWYITTDENVASIKLAESCGFRLVGTGARVSRYGLRVFGRFKILNRMR